MGERYFTRSWKRGLHYVLGGANRGFERERWILLGEAARLFGIVDRRIGDRCLREFAAVYGKALAASWARLGQHARVEPPVFESSPQVVAERGLKPSDAISAENREML